MSVPQSKAKAQTATETITGTVIGVRFHNPQNGWTVLQLSAAGEPIVAVGPLVNPREGDEYEFRGRWTNHSKFGRQFQFESAELKLPSTKKGIIRYLASIAYGVGEVKAARIVGALGEDCLTKLQETPDLIDTVSFLTANQKEEIKQHLQENQVVADLSALICREGITPNLVTRIVKHYGNDAVQVVKENPYKLAEDIEQIGFVTADRIAMAIGIAPDSPYRVQAAVRHILSEAQNDGHCYLRPNDFVREVPSLLGTDIPVGKIAEAVKALIDAGMLARDGDDIYLAELHEAEVEVAERIRALAAEKPPEIADLDGLIEKAQTNAGITYHPKQQEAIHMALTSGFSVITGGPGVGKSTITRAFVAIHKGERHTKPVYLCSPTGRAAKRLAEATGEPASTIHRLLGYVPDLGFTKNEDEPLQPGLLLVDEGCLWWKTPVLLADGSWEYIGKIVNHRLSVKVMSYNPATGSLEPRSVVNWFKYPRKSMLLEIDVTRNGSNRRRRIIRCTPQHMIATREGFKRADELRCGDRVLVRGRFLTDFQRQIIFGSLLGDSHLHGLKDVRPGSYQVTFMQGEKQKAYLDFKISQFPGLFTSPPRSQPSGYGCGTMVWYATMNLLDEMDYLVPIVAPRGKVEITKAFLDLLDARGLAILYMDNGTLSRTNGTPYVSLHTERFSITENEILASWLREQVGPGVNVAQCKGRYQYLRLSKEASARFLDLVEPYIPPAMAYKHRNPDAACFAPEPTLIDVGEVPIRSIRKFDNVKSYGKHVYDIEVEGLHNYVAGNIVVHNSMMDLPLARALFDACANGMQVVLIGDVDQLPSVGPGSVLRDIIDSGAVPVTRLEYVYRQEAGSGISALAHQINQGVIPELSTGKDVIAIEITNPDEAVPLAAKYAKQACDLYGPLGFAVLAPMYKGGSGVKALNGVIRSALNPGEGNGFRLGDRVLVTKNSYKWDIFNGDLGIVTAFDDENEVMTVDFGDKTVDFGPESEGYADLGLLQLAWASTVHRAQGGEFPVCIVVLTRQHWIMLARNLLYTAITRAKKHLILIHQPGAIAQAVRNNKIAARNSRLAERLRGEK